MNYGHHKLTREQIIQIANARLPPKVLAANHGITISMVSYIRNGGRHKEITGIQSNANRYKRAWEID